MHSASDCAAWAACLSVFERELTPQQFTTWIKPLACSNAPGRLHLVAPNRFVLQWVKERFGGRIEALAREAVGEHVAVEFAVADAGMQAPDGRPKPAGADDPAHKAPDETPGATAASARPPTGNGPGAGSPPSMGPLAIKPGGARRVEPGGLNPGFTFQAFVAGKA
ncbi:MAG TPA: DnaA N-terminal domain-containing protein, partial [Casimicrobiaceae bacterium]|nr:DnaA N-terminal domain-containing protein [Casimicrobiaceae bacterium]